MEHILSEAVIHERLMQLLSSNNETSIECLCQLLTITGQELDSKQSKVSLSVVLTSTSHLSISLELARQMHLQAERNKSVFCIITTGLRTTA